MGGGPGGDGKDREDCWFSRNGEIGGDDGDGRDCGAREDGGASGLTHRSE